MRIIYLLLALAFIVHETKGDLLNDGIFLNLLDNVFVREIRTTGDKNPIINPRRITIILNAAYDALVPYLPNSKAFYSNIPKRPENERTARNKNIAIAYAMFRTGVVELPQTRFQLESLFNLIGLNPNDNSLDITTPIGIGNYAAMKVLEVRLHDGMNELGDLSRKKYNRRPYEDYTGYVPKNTAYYLRDPSKWQPDIVLTSPDGTYAVQQHLYPQRPFTKSYAINQFAYKIPPPPTRDPKSTEYKQVVDEILKISSELDDYKKMATEYFNQEFLSHYQPIVFLIEKYKLDQDEAVKVLFLANMASFDALTAVSVQKRIYDATRPLMAVRFLYNNTELTAYGGPGVGTVNDITGWEWRPYLRTSQTSEYPSGASGDCAAHFSALEKYFGSENLFGFKVLRKKGSSQFEPNITPKEDIIIGPYNTFTEIVNECAHSRSWGGVHFRPSTVVGKQLGREVGIDVFNFAIKLLKADNFTQLM